MNDDARKTRKAAAEKIRQAIKELRSVGDHGTAERLSPILDRLNSRRAADNTSAGSQ